MNGFLSPRFVLLSIALFSVSFWSAPTASEPFKETREEGASAFKFLPAPAALYSALGREEKTALTTGMGEVPESCDKPVLDTSIASVTGIKGVFSEFEIELVQKVLMQVLVRSQQHNADRLLQLATSDTSALCSREDCAPVKYTGPAVVGTVQMESGEGVDFSAEHGRIEWVSKQSKDSGSINAHRFLLALSGDEERKVTAKIHPLVIMGFGWLAIHGGCIASVANCMYACGQECKCGMQSVETVLCGAASCRCNCFPCPEDPPTPEAMWPGSAIGPWYTGVPWNFSMGGPFVVDPLNPIGVLDPQ